MDYKIDDKVWFIPDDYLLVIECKVIEVDDQFRKQEPQAYIWYSLDEPVGHDVGIDQLFKTKEEALGILKYRKAILKFKLDTLDKYRKDRIEFIINTWTDDILEKEFKKKIWYKTLPNKEYNKQWFNVESLK